MHFLHLFLPIPCLDLKVFLEQLDYHIVREKNKPISSSLNKVMEKAKLKDELHIVGPMVIRSMSKAK